MTGVFECGNLDTNLKLRRIVKEGNISELQRFILASMEARLGASEQGLHCLSVRPFVRSFVCLVLYNLFNFLFTLFIIFFKVVALVVKIYSRNVETCF